MYQNFPSCPSGHPFVGLVQTWCADLECVLGNECCFFKAGNLIFGHSSSPPTPGCSFVFVYFDVSLYRVYSVTL